MLVFETDDAERRAADVPGDTSSTATITVGGTRAGDIGPDATDQDWYGVTLTAGVSYAITLDGSGASPLSDPFLSVFDQAGGLITSNDDGGDGLNSALTFTVTTTGPYFISAGAFGTPSTNIGHYVLAIAETAAPPPADLLRSIDWGTQVANPAVIDVYFAKAGESFGGDTSVGWSLHEKAQAMLAFQQFANVADVTFRITNNAALADFRLVAGDDPTSDTLGYFNPPGEQDQGVGWFNTAGAGWDTAGLAQGGYGFVTLIHEFGHGMGLAHPHDDGGTSVVMEGVTGPFDSYGDYNLNQGVFTTMSYNDGWPVGPTGLSDDFGFGWQGTMMALDVAVLQRKYGANTSYHAGDDVYALPTADKAGTYFSSLWDGGGADEIRYAGSSAAVIDLRPASLVYAVGGGGYVSHVAGVVGGFTIAAGVVIENATGGSGNDTLTGNDAANVLNGGAGADTMAGGFGDDRYLVTDVRDIVREALNAGVDRVDAGVSYTLGANIETLRLTGLAAIDGTGNDLANILLGNAAANLLDGRNGADDMRGGAGDDRYAVNNVGDRVTEAADGGVDTVQAVVTYSLSENVENLTLLSPRALDGFGNGLDNLIIGNAAANLLDGGGGADDLRGGLGDDIYIVDDAGDRATEVSGGGMDTVRSAVTYTLSADVEKLELTGGAAIGGFGNEAANDLTGNAAANRLDGGGGNDVMRGGLGDDRYVVDSVGDRVIEAAAEGKDIVEASVSFTLSDNVENLKLVGGAAIDAMGNAGANTIAGNGAANVLNGGSGSDVLTGGLGADTFVFDTALGRGNLDRILDFTAADDTIRLDDSVFLGLKVGALAASAFTIGAAAADAFDRIVYDSGTGALFFDRDGSATTYAAAQFATIAANLAITNADFMVV